MSNHDSYSDCEFPVLGNETSGIDNSRPWLQCAAAPAWETGFD